MAVDDRPTKKQQELFEYVRDFISEHGYGPSYREIMTALGYKSVSTVAVHVEGLITKNMLERTDASARSLSVVSSTKKESPAVVELKKLRTELTDQEQKTVDDTIKLLQRRDV